jgi:hypothetical protein
MTIISLLKQMKREIFDLSERRLKGYFCLKKLSKFSVVIIDLYVRMKTSRKLSSVHLFINQYQQTNTFVTLKKQL